MVYSQKMNVNPDTDFHIYSTLKEMQILCLDYMLFFQFAIQARFTSNRGMGVLVLLFKKWIDLMMLKSGYKREMYTTNKKGSAERDLWRVRPICLKKKSC